MHSSILSRGGALALVTAGTMLLAACGGGGGGAIAAPGNPVAPVIAPPIVPIIPVAPVTPATTSAEYRRNWGVANVKAEAAWAAGATGAGIKVAVIDTGVIATTTDLSGRVSADSVDIITTRPAGDIQDDHASNIAGIIGANFNGSGTVGIAYEAEILSVRTDRAGSCATACKFNDNDIGRSIDYAVSHGAKVINLSLGAEDPSSFSFQLALKRATDAGIVVVIAAGNESGADPQWPARYAADSRFSGMVIAVGALGRDGVNLAAFSNRAGLVQNVYIAAPGEAVTSDCDGSSCRTISGTSFATPHVAAAVALLLDGFPNISGHDAVDIILRSARDLGVAGIDATFGRGTLDIARAFQPLGTLSVPTSSGTMAAADATPGTVLSSAFGDALMGSTALATIGYDDYNRMFSVDLGTSYRGPGRRSLLAAHSGPVHTTTAQFATGEDSSLTLTAQASSRREETVLGLLQPTAPESLAASFVDGPFRLDLWSGRGGAAASFQNAPSDPFTGLVRSGQAARIGYTAGPWTFSAEQGAGESTDQSPLALTAQPFANSTDRSRYARWTVSRRSDRLATAVSYGALREDGGPLGSWLPTELALSLPAKSSFISLRQEWRPVDGVSLAAEAALGRTDAKGPLLSLDRAISSSWRLSAAANCAHVGLGCTGLSFDVSQPLRIEGGYATAMLADRPADYFGPVTFSARRLELSPSGREIDFRLSVWKDLDEGSVLSLHASALTDERHVQGSSVNYGLLGAWRSRF